MLIHAIVNGGWVGVGGCDLGGTDTRKKSVLKVDSWIKINCHTGESNLRQQCAGPMLYQVSIIPTLYYTVPAMANVRVCACVVCVLLIIS